MVSEVDYFHIASTKCDANRQKVNQKMFRIKDEPIGKFQIQNTEKIYSKILNLYKIEQKDEKCFSGNI